MSNSFLFNYLDTMRAAVNTNTQPAKPTSQKAR